jgi:hypothetical protein
MARASGATAASPLREALPFVAAAALAALLLLLPMYVAPRTRMPDVIEDHVGQLTLVGGTGCLLVAVFLVLWFLG